MILVLFALPFIIYSITTDNNNNSDADNVQNSKFIERISVVEYEEQTKKFTEDELDKLQNYIKQNPSVIDSTEHYKRSLTNESS